jgi:hypothetical protein
MHKIVIATLLLAMSTMLASCGGGGGAGSGSAAGAIEMATVGLVITDLSSEDYDHAWATITSVTLIGNDGHELIFSGNKKIDLLALRDHLKLFFVNRQVKPGFYSKIRLQVQELLLVKNNDGASPTEEYVDLVANGKVDLNPQSTIYVAPGSVVYASFDWDIDKSLKLTQTGSGKIKMRPVIFVDIGTKPMFKKGLTRLFGTIVSVAADDTHFLLCSLSAATPVTPGDVIKEFCVDVLVEPETGLFDAKGIPMTADKLEPKQEVTVLGLVRRAEDAPDPKPSLSKDDDAAPFQIVSIVVEGGSIDTWKQIRGVLTTAVDPATNTFGFDPNPGQGFPDPEVLTGQLFGTTRIFQLEHDGGITEIAPGSLKTSDRATVDAVQVPPAVAGDPTGLNIAVMLSRPFVAPLPDTLTGKITSVMPNLVVDGRTVCTNFTTKVFLLSATGDVTESDLSKLTVGSVAVVSGNDDLACMEADVIVSQSQVGPV